MPHRKRNSTSIRTSATYWGIAAAWSVLAAAAVLWTGAAPIETISLTRVVLAAVPVAGAAAALLSMVRLLAGRDSLVERFAAGTGRSQLMTRLARVSVVAGLIALCLPSYTFADFSAYYERVRPLIIWAGGLGLLLLLRHAGEAEDRWHPRAWLERYRPTVKMSAWIFFGMVLSGILMLWALRSVSTYEDYRYEAAVPILVLQVVMSALAGLWLHRILQGRAEANLARLDRWMFVLVWLITALYWAATPATHSYMNPAPIPPNQEVYPNSDAAQYDLQAQAALLGQGLDNGRSMDNPMYPAFLALVHVVSGQDFEANMAVQAAILAVLPAIVYLLGRELHNRPLGAAAACMTAFQGANSITAASIINSASPKQMLTDFPAAIATALVLLTALRLLRRRGEGIEDAIWHGTSLGFAFLLRPTTGVLLVLVPIITLLSRMRWKEWLTQCLVIAAGFVLLAAPWGIRNQVRNQNAFDAYLSKLNLVVGTRYRDLEPQPYQAADPPAAQESPAVPRAEPEYTERAGPKRVGPVVLQHFANNVLASVFSLPTSPVLHDLAHTLKAPGSAWHASWVGGMKTEEIAWLLVPAVFLAIGGAFLWRSSGPAAMVPLLGLVLYHAANSVGRTSGGRYVVPVGWIVLLYFAAGLLAVLNLGGQAAGKQNGQRSATRRNDARSALVALLCVVVLGASPVFVESAFPARFPTGEAASVEAEGAARSLLLDSGYSPAAVDQYLATRRVVSLKGRAMYPEWYSYRALARGTEGALEGIAFPHLEFTLIDPQRGHSEVYLFTTGPIELANTSDVVVIGCRQRGTGFIDAAAVVEARPGASPLFRSMLDDLRCPVPMPVCDNNGVCR